MILEVFSDLGFYASVTGALSQTVPLALLKAEVTIPFLSHLPFEGHRCALVFPVTCCCSRVQLSPLEGMLVADAPPGGANSNLP